MRLFERRKGGFKIECFDPYLVKLRDVSFRVISWLMGGPVCL